MTDRNEDVAQSNFSWLRNNPYPGRGIVGGLDETGVYLVQVYWIMGRSENSRNRVFKADDDTGRLYTEAADAAKMKDPSLVIYNAMRERGGDYIVSNGEQTDAVVAAWDLPYLNESLKGWVYEPDAPNFTQRITAVISWKHLQMSILRKSVFWDHCDSLTYEYIPYSGFGHCITTYYGDGNPLPPFCEEPLIMPIRGGIEKVAQTYWGALNEENRVSIGVKFITKYGGDSQIHIINKYTQIG